MIGLSEKAAAANPALARWLALLMASSLAVEGGVNTELVQTAILRARLCELLSGASGRRPRPPATPPPRRWTRGFREGAGWTG